MSQWFYTSNGGQQGPVSAEQLAEWARGGMLRSDTHVWRDGMAQWTPAGQVPELAPLFAATSSQYPTGAAYAAPVAAASPLGYAQAPGAYIGSQNYAYGGFWWRFLAVIIDGIVLWIPNKLIELALQASMDIQELIKVDQRGNFQIDPKFWGYVGVAFASSTILYWLYYATMESSKYQGTLGKRVCGLIVTDLNGQRLTFAHATGRYFAKLLSTITLYIGYIMAAFTERKQGLHDIVAKTLVWKKP